MLGLSLVAASRGYSSLRCGLLIKVASLAVEYRSRHLGFSSCGPWALWFRLVGSRPLAQ